MTKSNDQNPRQTWLTQGKRIEHIASGLVSELGMSLEARQPKGTEQPYVVSST